MKILYFPLKAKYYKMIERGEKREEYREIRSYWLNRLRDKARTCVDKKICRCKCTRECWEIDRCGFEPFDAVCFSYGYTKRRMLWECKGITFGQGRPEWGAPDYETFIIKFGKRIQ